jgi:hypothetical protein
MEFKFEKLIIWHKAMDLGEEINILAKIFPSKERFTIFPLKLEGLPTQSL